jgi:hypothetical protein
LTNCKKQIQQDSLNQLQPDRKFADISKFLKERQASITQEEKLIKERLKSIYEQTALIFQQEAGFKSQRLQFRNSQQVNSTINARSGGVIQVPGDYANLQDAVNNAQTGDKILVKAPLINQGNVLADVTGLTITGDANASVSGLAIYLIASNIEVRNLNLRTNLVIGSAASGAKVMNNNFTSVPNVTVGSNTGLILMSNVSGCSIKNNTITDAGSTLISGINASDCSNNIFESNIISGGSNTVGHMLFTNSANNQVKNCTVKDGGLGTGFPSSAGILFTGTANTNTITGCNANNLNGNGIWFTFSTGGNNEIVNCNAFQCNNGYGFNCQDVGNTNNLYSNCSAKYCSREGMNILSNNSIIKNCVAENSGVGIVFGDFGGSNNSMTNCKVNNNLSNFGIIYLTFGPNGTALIENCEAKNTTNGGNGIFVLPLAPNFNMTVKGCKATNNSGIGIYGLNFGGAGSLTLLNNESNNNLQGGFQLENLNNSIVTNNKAKDNVPCDYREMNCTGTVLTGNHLGLICN